MSDQPPPIDPLQTLADASTSRELLKAHRKVTASTIASRRAAQRELGPLAATFKGALEVAERMRADGASRDQIEHYVGDVLREAWPKGRQEPWHYYCEQCSDTGWAFRTCQQRSCGRPFRLPGQGADDHTGQGHCTEDHSYVEPCICAKGDERQRRLMKQRREEDAVAVAARSRPTRIGR